MDLRSLTIGLTLTAVLALAGCGGAGQTASSESAGSGGKDLNIGSLVARASSGTAVPLVINGFTGQAGFFAMYGATFTRVAYTPARTLSNTRIAFGRTGGNLWTCAPDGSHLFMVTNDMNFGGAISPSWSPDAFRILFQG